MVSGLSPAGMVPPMGFEESWRASRWQPPSASAAAATNRQSARQREDIEHASRGSFAGQVFDRIGKAERRSRVTRIELAVDDPTGPAADSGDDRDILPAVGPAVADRLADDPAAGLEPPDELAGPRVERFEPAIKRPVEDQAPAGRQCGAPDRQILVNLPCRAPGDRVPCRHCAAVTAWTTVHFHVGSDER